jgi:hypothetical protein
MNVLFLPEKTKRVLAKLDDCSTGRCELELNWGEAQCLWEYVEILKARIRALENEARIRDQEIYRLRLWGSDGEPPGELAKPEDYAEPTAKG